MFQSSKDILYLVSSLCIISLTVFLCWMFYYLMRIFKDTSKIIEEFRMRLQSLTEMIKNISDKVEKLHGVISLVSSGIGNLMNRKGSKKENDEDSLASKTSRFEEAAKEVVDKAVETTAEKIRKITRKIKR